MNHFSTTLVWLCMMILSMPLSYGASIDSSDFNQEFSAANELFAQANRKALENPAEAQELYQESILKYQFLTESSHAGVASAELHTNLGNAYFFAGDQGRAVLNYQRALSLDPLQEKALHNLHYARSLTIDELPATHTQQIIEALSFWHRWSWTTRLVILALANTLLWVALARLLYGRTRWHYLSIAALAAITLIFTLSVVTSQQRWDNEVDAVVVEREVIARQGDGYIYDNAFTSPLHAGTEFSVLERRGNWYHARLLDGTTCWLPGTGIDLVKKTSKNID